MLQRLGSAWAGRWQGPLALLAAVSAAVALYSVRPSGPPMDFERIRTDLLALREAGDYTGAADAAADLLREPGSWSAEERRWLHDHLAEVIYRLELDRPLHSPRNVRRLLEHHQQARSLGQVEDARRLLRVATAYEWAGQNGPAIAHYHAVLAAEPPPPERSAARLALIRLLEEDEDRRPERVRLLEEVVQEPGLSARQRWWALLEAVDDALSRGDLNMARDWLERQEAAFQRSDLRAHFEHLRARVMLAEGDYGSAERVARWVSAWLEENGPPGAELDRDAYLPDLNTRLLARIELVAQRPQAALGILAGLQRRAPQGRLAIDIALARVEALAMLERHEAARREAGRLLEMLRRGPTRPADARRVREVLRGLARDRRGFADYENALGYLRQVLDLTDPRQPDERLGVLEELGALAGLAADRQSDARMARALRQEAGAALRGAADLAMMEESRRADLLWSAGQQFLAAGMWSEARGALQEFIGWRSLDSRLPRALLQIAETYEAEEQWSEALRSYRQLRETFPRLEEAVLAQLRAADCLLGMGAGQDEQAERMLMGVLEDDHIAPNAYVFREALVSLCQLLHGQGRYAEAISRLEDAIALYPEDPQTLLLRFLLADSYRRSAYRLRDAPPREASLEYTHQESRARFRRAAEEFAEFLRRVAQSHVRDPRVREYERAGYFYRAECLYELSEPQTLREALAAYRQLSVRYQNEPAALSAQVQIANIHLRLGNVEEAARAVERARWIVRSIPASSFDAAPEGLSRQSWENYLAAVAGSHFLRQALAAER